MSIRWAALGATAALLLAACGVGEASETVLREAPRVDPAPAVTPAAVPAEDLAAIASYWEAREAAFLQSPVDGVAFIVDRLHPDLDYSAGDCMEAWFGDAASASFVERSTPDLDSVALMDDWVMTIGARQIAPGEGVYRVEVDLAYEGAPTWWPDRRVAAFLQVTDGAIRNFVRCEVAQVQSAGQPAPALPTAPSAPAKEPVETLVRTVSVRTLMAEDGTVTAASTPECPNPRIEVRDDTAYIFCPRPAPDAPQPGQPGVPAPDEPTEPTGSRPPGTGLDFCRGDGGERQQAGDYYACGYDEREPRAAD